VIVIWLILLAVSLYCVYDITQKSDAQWQAAGQNKILWIVLVLLFGILGSAVYWFAIRPKVVGQTA
jgi:hypothetical protein